LGKKSAGILMYRRRHGVLEVFLVHPGGPFWAKKDVGAWSIPKGEYSEQENPLEAARREFQEETGWESSGEFIPLTPRRQPSGKMISAWAVEGNCDASAIRSNSFTLEWPPRSGKQSEFPEVDRAGWFSIPEAEEKILKGQAGFLQELVRILGQAEKK
jgi:predicted NUDIX family NTP pyrophosphohydrolase